LSVLLFSARTCSLASEVRKLINSETHAWIRILEGLEIFESSGTEAFISFEMFERGRSKCCGLNRSTSVSLIGADPLPAFVVVPSLLLLPLAPVSVVVVVAAVG
jgi:hypothetical protein